MSDRGCSHLDAIESIKQPQRRECEECVKIGAYWVHLRTCQQCGTTSSSGSQKHGNGTRGSALLPYSLLRRVGGPQFPSLPCALPAPPFCKGHTKAPKIHQHRHSRVTYQCLKSEVIVDVDRFTNRLEFALALAASESLAQTFISHPITAPAFWTIE